MNLDRLGSGEKIAGISAVLLFVSMSFDWFGSKDSGELQLFSVGRSAWQALDFIPIVLLVTVITALGVVALRLTDPTYELPVRANAVVAILGIVSVLLIVFRIVEPPNFGSFRELWGTITIEGTVKFPIFLALTGALGIAFGGCLAIWEERDSLRSLT